MAEADEAAPEGEGDGKKKKGMKGLIIKIVPLVIIALLAAKMTVLKPPPPTEAQKRAKAALAQNALDIKCALANNKKPPAPLDPKTAGDPAAAKAAKSSTPTTTEAGAPVEPATEAGPILTLDSVTVNLADGGDHFLKIGVSLQMPPKTVIDTVKLDNPGSPALNYIIGVMRQKTRAELSKPLEPLREEIGYKVCDTPALNDGGAITTVYFTDFVTQ